MNDKQLDDWLRRELEALPREIPPRRDLWPGIAHALGRAPRWLPLRAAAGALILAASVGLWVGSRIGSDEDAMLADYILAMQAEHEQSKQALLVQYGGERPRAPDWERQMDELEQAEYILYEALRERPDNLALLKMLRRVQSQQIDLIEAALAPNYMTI